MRERLVFIDILKCFLIILVIWGHVIQYCGISDEINEAIYYDWILTFHMPLFAVISGFLFHVRGSFIHFFFLKAKSLIVPLLSWSFIISVIIPVICYLKNGIIIEIDVIGLLRIGKEYIRDNGLWFLKALFFTYLYAAFFNRYIKSTISAAIISILLLYSCSLSGLIPNMHPLFKGFIFLFPFFQVGILLNQYWTSVIKYMNRILIICFAIYFLMIHFWRGLPDGFYYMDTCIVFQQTNYYTLYRIIFRFLIGFIGSVGFFLLFYSLLRHCANTKFLKACSSIGQHTIEIYILSSCLNDFMFKIPFYPSNSCILIIECFFVSLTILIGCYFAPRIIKNDICYLLLFGKKRMNLLQ